MSSTVLIIGAGVSGLSTAALLAHENIDSTIYEKSSQVIYRINIIPKSCSTCKTGVKINWESLVGEFVYSSNIHHYKTRKTTENIFFRIKTMY